jgi:hypothetical protein
MSGPQLEAVVTDVEAEAALYWARLRHEAEDRPPGGQFGTISGRERAWLQGLSERRDPDPNRGHHDFQKAVSQPLNPQNSLQTEQRLTGSPH